MAANAVCVDSEKSKATPLLVILGLRFSNSGQGQIAGQCCWLFLPRVLVSMALHLSPSSQQAGANYYGFCAIVFCARMLCRKLGHFPLVFPVYAIEQDMNDGRPYSLPRLFAKESNGQLSCSLTVKGCAPERGIIPF